MLFWIMITIILGFLGAVEPLLGFTLPFAELRVVLLLLLVLGMAYRLYSMERSGEKEALRAKLRELEEKLEGEGD